MTAGSRRFRFARAAGVLALASAATTVMAADSPAPERLVLDNGVTVLTLPVPEATMVGIETVYDVGFVHEPAGMTQAAHLLEHLVCHGPVEGYDARESMQLVNGLGLANAETLGDWTHYDYAVPPDRLETVLRIEAARLTSLRIEQDLVDAEARRCYHETDIVERNPVGGMAKHALMAACQSWRGRDAALVRGGLESLDLDRLASMHGSSYLPEQLTIAIVGRFDRAEAIELVREHLGGIEIASAGALTPIDWSAVRPHAELLWDASLSGICVAFPPPDDPVERLALTLLGQIVCSRLSSDRELRGLTGLISGTSRIAPVGQLPLFVWVPVDSKTTVEEVQTRVGPAWDRMLRSLEGPATIAVVRMRAGQLRRQPALGDPEQVAQQVDLLIKQRGLDRHRAEALVLVQAALDWAIADRILGPDADQAVSAVDAMTEPQLAALIARVLADDRRRVTIVRAGKPARDQRPRKPTASPASPEADDGK